MPDIFDLLIRWWKRIFVVIFLSVAAVGVIVFMQPKLYLSMATSVPASSYASDKAKVFNDKIESLYSDLGGSDELDRILGTASLDTVFLAVTDSFSLQDHYKISNGEETREKTAGKLKSRVRIIKSDYGELKVKVWDTDKNLAPQLANAIMNKLGRIHQDLQAAGNASTLAGLQKNLARFKLENDSISIGTSDVMNAHKKILMDNIISYEQLIGQYQLMVDNKPPVLVTVEKARTALKPDKPHRLQAMLAAALLSFIFAIFAALVLDRKKTPA